MKKYEYLTITLSEYSFPTETLNYYGDKGWEMVGVAVGSLSMVTLFFKREVP